MINENLEIRPLLIPTVYRSGEWGLGCGGRGWIMGVASLRLFSIYCTICHPLPPTLHPSLLKRASYNELSPKFETKVLMAYLHNMFVCVFLCVGV